MVGLPLSWRAVPLVRPLASADTALLRAVRSAARPPAVARGVARFSALGEHAGIWLALGGAGALLDPRRRPAWQRATAGVLAANVVNVLVKLAVGRARPQLADLPPLIATPTQLSFPSAHATTGFAGARAYSALIPARPLYVLAAALALSRVYLGVHYPTDIAAGAVLGTLIGSVAR